MINQTLNRTGCDLLQIEGAPCAPSLLSPFGGKGAIHPPHIMRTGGSVGNCYHGFGHYYNQSNERNI